MKRAISKDGTPIAYDQAGQGPPIILVDGALCSRSFGPMPKLAPLLARHFTVFTYDRRGRNASGDTAPYSVEREVEDLEAVIDEAGGSAFVFGISSGAALVLTAAARGLNIKKLALWLKHHEILVPHIPGREKDGRDARARDELPQREASRFQ